MLNNKNSTPKLGYGYNSINNRLLSTKAVTSKEKEDSAKIIKNEYVVIFLSNQEDMERIVRLALNTTVPITQEFLTLKAGINYSSISKKLNMEAYCISIYRRSYIEELLNPNLTAEASELLNNNLAEFNNAYGDKFVNTVERKCEFIATYKLSIQQTQSNREFGETLGIGKAGIAEGNQTIAILSQNARSLTLSNFMLRSITGSASGQIPAINNIQDFIDKIPGVIRELKEAPYPCSTARYNIIPGLFNNSNLNELKKRVKQLYGKNTELEGLSVKKIIILTNKLRFYLKKLKSLKFDIDKSMSPNEHKKYAEYIEEIKNSPWDFEKKQQEYEKELCHKIKKLEEMEIFIASRNINVINVNEKLKNKVNEFKEILQWYKDNRMDLKFQINHIPIRLRQCGPSIKMVGSYYYFYENLTSFEPYYNSALETNNVSDDKINFLYFKISGLSASNTYNLHYLNFNDKTKTEITIAKDINPSGAFLPKDIINEIINDKIYTLAVSINGEFDKPVILEIYASRFPLINELIKNKYGEYIKPSFESKRGIGFDKYNLMHEETFIDYESDTEQEVSLIKFNT